MHMVFWFVKHRRLHPEVGKPMFEGGSDCFDCSEDKRGTWSQVGKNRKLVGNITFDLCVGVLLCTARKIIFDTVHKTVHSAINC